MSFRGKTRCSTSSDGPVDDFGVEAQFKLFGVIKEHTDVTVLLRGHGDQRQANAEEVLRHLFLGARAYSLDSAFGSPCDSD
jgi:hypothetical protein